MRPRIIGVSVVLATAGCGGAAAVTTTTAPSTTTSTSTTTTTVAEVEIPETGILKFRAGTVFVASGFWVPLSFTTEQDGLWWSRGGTEEWVHVEYHENGASVTDLDLTVFVHAPTAAVDDVVTSIMETEIDYYIEPDPGEETARVLEVASPTRVGGFAAQVFDLFVPRGGYDEGPNARGNTLFFRVIPALSVTEILPNAVTAGEDARIGIRHGRAARVWVVDVDGTTVTIIAAATNRELFDGLIDEADRLVAGIEFRP